MNDRILKFADSKQYLGKIARSGENNTRSLAFDCSAALEEYPNAQIIAVIQRPQGDPYTVTPDADGMIRRITLTSYDLEFNGHLHVELRVLDGDKILKSAIYTAMVDDSIRGEADAPGQPVRDVLDRLEAEIKQAQAVVDDIRQKLENGEFNGSDAEVTAANIEAALGYAPVTPSELTEKQDVLTDADKQSITKTGMTSGAAWTSAEQKAARDRMGVDKAYELIETITLTEGTIYLVRNVSLRTLYVEIETPDTATANSNDEYVVLDIGSVQLSMYCGKIAMAGQKRQAKLLAEQKGGKYMVTVYGAGKPTNTLSAYFQHNAIGVDGDKISKIHFTNAKLPVGTIIKIYGVSA